MEHYVTLYDSLFLPQGLALHMSMERHVKHYTLWILCVDDEAHAVLTKLQLPNVRLLQLSQLETENLLSVKLLRNKGEYCWTLTPFAPKFVFEADQNVKRVTYLDADVWFHDHPKPIFNEFNASDKKVLITGHAYAPEYDMSERSGRYCVQFMIFTRNQSEEVRKWWEDKCIEWCYARFENGKFGDQKYLDEWPTRFPKLIHEINRAKEFQAPWNAVRANPSDCIVYHFHGLRIEISDKSIKLKSFGYKIPKTTVSILYIPYADDLKQSIKMLSLDAGHKLTSQIPIISSFKVFLRKIFSLSNKNFELKLR
jgi:hypothetical protein